MWSLPAVPTIVACLPAQVAAEVLPEAGTNRPTPTASMVRRQRDLQAIFMVLPVIGKKRPLLQPSQHPSTPRITRTDAWLDTLARMRGGTYVLNFYSAVFVDQLKRGRKTATI